jgi:hypothetical protein
VQARSLQQNRPAFDISKLDLSKLPNLPALGLLPQVNPMHVCGWNVLHVHYCIHVAACFEVTLDLSKLPNLPALGLLPQMS